MCVVVFSFVLVTRICTTSTLRIRYLFYSIIHMKNVLVVSLSLHIGVSAR